MGVIYAENYCISTLIPIHVSWTWCLNEIYFVGNEKSFNVSRDSRTTIFTQLFSEFEQCWDSINCSVFGLNSSRQNLCTCKQPNCWIKFQLFVTPQNEWTQRTKRNEHPAMNHEISPLRMTQFSASGTITHRQTLTSIDVSWKMHQNFSNRAASLPLRLTAIVLEKKKLFVRKLFSYKFEVYSPMVSPLSVQAELNMHLWMHLLKKYSHKMLKCVFWIPEVE